MKKAVKFDTTHTFIPTNQVAKQNGPEHDYLVTQLKGMETGDYKVLDLTENHKLIVNAADRGLYAGWICKSDGDVIHQFDPDLVGNILNNLEAKHLKLLKRACGAW